MKDQYVGDINDYRKYALLRALAAGGTVRIGVCWMLTPSDASADGGKLAYLEKPKAHRHHDPELFDILSRAATQPDWRRLRTIENSGAIHGVRYFNAPLSDGAEERRAYMAVCAKALADVDLIFFDPDNGLEVKKPRIGNKGSSKYLYEAELKATYDSGRSVLVYQHFPFIKKEVFIASCLQRLRHLAPDATLGTFRTAHVVFLLLLNPHSPSRLVEAARDAAGRWDAKFITGSLYEPDEALPAPATEQLPSDDQQPSTEEGSGDDEVAAPPAPPEEGPSEPKVAPTLLKRLLRRLG